MPIDTKWTHWNSAKKRADEMHPCISPENLGNLNTRLVTRQNELVPTGGCALPNILPITIMIAKYFFMNMLLYYYYDTEHEQEAYCILYVSSDDSVFEMWSLLYFMLFHAISP